MRAERFTFPGSQSGLLAARLDEPDSSAVATALFAHYFTCTKDILAANRIAAALVEDGIAVLRFDFTGLGPSEGEFANTGFSSNFEDLIAAAGHLRGRGREPALLIGHSLGEAADCATREKKEGRIDRIALADPLDPAQRARLLEIADKCPVHRTLHAEVLIETVEAGLQAGGSDAPPRRSEGCAAP